VRVMHKTFDDLIRDLVEVYVDNTIVKVKCIPAEQSCPSF
jgi:hypothetical protein